MPFKIYKFKITLWEDIWNSISLRIISGGCKPNRHGHAHFRFDSRDCECAREEALLQGSTSAVRSSSGLKLIIIIIISKIFTIRKIIYFNFFNHF